MKNITKVVVFALVMIVFHVNTYAQKSEQQRMTREQLAETQAQFDSHANRESICIGKKNDEPTVSTFSK